MAQRKPPGQIVNLNGAPRSGKSSIVAAIQDTFDSVRMNPRLNAVMDVGRNDACSVPRGILPDCARRLQGLPVLFVGVRCLPGGHRGAPSGFRLPRRRVP